MQQRPRLVNPETGDWNREMIQKLGYPEKIFLPIREPGTVIGRLKKEIQEQVGFDCEIVLPATHDTGSAVVAVPSNEEHVLYIRLRNLVSDGNRIKRGRLRNRSYAAQFYQ